MRIGIIAGARPNFMKIAPIVHAIEAARASGQEISYRLIHTGQHYDKVMSDTFFDQLDIPKPDVNLGAGSGTQAEQTAAIMIGFEKDLAEYPQDIVLVVGDVNSTMACAIVAKKMQTRVGHVEGGIRSGDFAMPEEINRIVTDSISDFFFTTTQEANKNLLKEGATNEQIFLVGNTMIDTLLKLRSRFLKPKVWDDLRLESGQYLLMTLHRPSNVDNLDQLRMILGEIADNSSGTPVVFAAHPRTTKQLEKIGKLHSTFKLIKPLGYLEFNYLVENARGIITDSGGITEETTVMNIPCMTLRNTTERPETVSIGTNELVGTVPENIGDAVRRISSGVWKKGRVPELWDGHAATRIIEILLKISTTK